MNPGRCDANRTAQRQGGQDENRSVGWWGTLFDGGRAVGDTELRTSRRQGRVHDGRDQHALGSSDRARSPGDWSPGHVGESEDPMSKLRLLLAELELALVFVFTQMLFNPHRRRVV